MDRIGRVGLLRIRDPLLRHFTYVIFGFPIGFWFAGQGSLIAFVILLFWFARKQNQIDQEHGVAED